MKYQLEVRSDLVVVGHNPENADMDRPNGEVIGERFYMVAGDEQGYTRVWGWADSVTRLEQDFEMLAPPIAFWPEGRPVYGTRAWVDSNQDAEDDFSERRAYDVPSGFEPGPFARIY